MPEMRLRPGLQSPGSRWGSGLDLLAGFKGATSKGRGREGSEGRMGRKGRKGKGRRGGREGEGRGGKGRGGEGGLTPTFLYPPPPLAIWQQWTSEG